MKLDTRSHQRVARPLTTAHVSAPVRSAPRSRRLFLALVLVTLAGFLLGLVLPAHP